MMNSNLYIQTSWLVELAECWKQLDLELCFKLDSVIVCDCEVQLCTDSTLQAVHGCS